MRRFTQVIGNIKMTTAILALVMIAIIGSIASVSGAIYLNIHNDALAASKEVQTANLGVAATILERRISGSTLAWTAEGTIGSFQAWKIPQFDGNEIIESVTRVTKQDASVYALDTSTKSFVIKSSSLVADLSSVPDMSIDVNSPAYAALIDHNSFVGEVVINGEMYLAAFQPISDNMTRQVIGAIFVGTRMENVQASANGILGTIFMIGGPVTILFGVVGFALSRLMTKPIPRLAKSMERIAQGDYTTEVPYAHLGNEVGTMARAVEIFRENGLRVSQMTDADTARVVADQNNRQRMMAELQTAFGEVVDAAVAGDFSRQVLMEFPDPELNRLAASVNRLVATFGRGTTEIGEVLGAMANTDFTLRMTGDYEGAFAQLKSDVNAVANRLAEIIGKLRYTSGSLKTATGELLSGANDLSERTTRQAATIEETSAAIGQLANTVLENAARADEANSKAILVCETAEGGGVVMSQTTQAMEKISRSSGKISNIIGMIDDIAFQTNLLALNASVEAARAGEDSSHLFVA